MMSGACNLESGYYGIAGFGARVPGGPVKTEAIGARRTRPAGINLSLTVRWRSRRQEFVRLCEGDGAVDLRG